MTKPTLLLIRQVQASERIIQWLNPKARQAVDIVVSPLLQIVPLDVNINLDGIRGCVFTSANGVNFAPDGNGKPAYCVGKKTAETAAQRGWHVEVTMADANALVAHMTRHTFMGPLLHLAGRHRRGEVAQRLSATGERVDVLTIYDQHLMSLSEAAQNALSNEDTLIVPIFSPRSASQFAAQAGTLRNVTVIAMSEAVAEPLDPQFLHRLVIAPEPTGAKMVDLLEMLIIGTSLP